MQQVLHQAGFERKTLRGLGKLSSDVDGDGRLVNCAWKTWIWETAIEQICAVSEMEYAAVPICTGCSENEVQLTDVLLRPEVLAFGPL